MKSQLIEYLDFPDGAIEIKPAKAGEIIKSIASSPRPLLHFTEEREKSPVARLSRIYRLLL